MSDEAALMGVKQKLHRMLALGMGLMIISIWSQPVVAASPGSKVYKKVCQKCHGKQGQGKASRTDPSQFKYPPIHEMHEEDLLTAMARYKEMWRTEIYSKREKRMAKAAGQLSDEEMKAVIAFITSDLGREGK